jgi:hypothetical protein
VVVHRLSDNLFLIAAIFWQVEPFDAHSADRAKDQKNAFVMPSLQKMTTNIGSLQ